MNQPPTLWVCEALVADPEGMTLDNTGVFAAFIGSVAELSRTLEEWCDEFAARHNLSKGDVTYHVTDYDTALPYVVKVDGQVLKYCTTNGAAVNWALKKGILRPQNAGRVEIIRLKDEDILKEWLASKGHREFLSP